MGKKKNVHLVQFSSALQSYKLKDINLLYLIVLLTFSKEVLFLAAGILVA